jgi:hypothetical protein
MLLVKRYSSARMSEVSVLRRPSERMTDGELLSETPLLMVNGPR